MPGTAFVISKPFGVNIVLVDDGVSPQSSGRVKTGALNLPRGWRGDRTYIRTPILRPNELMEAAADVGGRDRAALEAMVTEFEPTWRSVASEGIPLIYYGAPPLSYHDVQSDELITDDNGLGLALGANMLIATDSTGRDALVDTMVGQADPIKRYLDWMASRYPDVPTFVEPGLPDETRTDVLDAYDNVHTMTIFDDLFDDEAWAP